MAKSHVRRWLSGVAVVAALLGAPSALQAYPYYRYDTGPGTLTLDRMDDSTRAGLQVGVNKLRDYGGESGLAMRFELYGQYVIPRRAFGLYGGVALSHLFANDTAPSGTGLSNIDVGAFFMPNHTSDLIFRLGLILPTASENESGALANDAVAFERLTDLLMQYSHLTTLRLSVSTVQQSGLAFFRGDLGFDLLLDNGDRFYGDTDAFLRLNLAAGVRLSPLDLAIELVNIGAIDGHQSGLADRFLHTVTVGFSTRGMDQFRAGLVFPLDDRVRNEIWILSLGYQHTQ